MSSKNLVVNCKCAIWDASITMTEHRDGSITLRYPVTVERRQNETVLDYRKVKIGAGKDAEAVRAAIANDTLEIAGRTMAYGCPVYVWDIIESYA